MSVITVVHISRQAFTSAFYKQINIGRSRRSNEDMNPILSFAVIRSLKEFAIIRAVVCKRYIK